MTVLFTAIMIFRGRSVNETVRSRVFQVSFFTNDIMIIGGREMSASKITSDVNTHPVTFFTACNNTDEYLFDSSSKDCS